MAGYQQEAPSEWTYTNWTASSAGIWWLGDNSGMLWCVFVHKHLLMEEQHIPILRYLSRELGAYDGTTNWEKYLVDAVSDIYVDWRVFDQLIQFPNTWR